MSKVLLNQNIFSKFSYNVVMYNSMYLSSHHFSSTWNFQNPKQTQLLHRSMFCGGLLFSSLKISQYSQDLGKSREGNPNFAQASVSSGLLARLTTLIKNEYGSLIVVCTTFTSTGEGLYFCPWCNY